MGLPEYICTKSEKLIPKITALCANTFGYSNDARKTMFDGTVGAIFRYGAAFFAHRLYHNRRRVDALHRRIVLTCGRLYRTVSYLPATAITNVPPLRLTTSAAGERRQREKNWTGMVEPDPFFHHIPDNPAETLRARLEEAVIGMWQKWYMTTPKGNWTKTLKLSTERKPLLKKYKLLCEYNFLRTKLFSELAFNKSIDGYKIRKFSSTIRQDVRIFFENDSVSKMCPGKKDCVTFKKVKMQKRLLLGSMKDLYPKFLESVPYKMGFSTFCKLKQFWVCIPKASDRNTCICRIHANIKLLVEAINACCPNC